MGIGTSSQVAVEQWNGIPFEKPYQRARDMLRFLRAALAGGEGHPAVRDVLGERVPARPGAGGAAGPGPGGAAARDGQAGGPGSPTPRSPTGWPPRTCPRSARWRARTVELIARIFVCPTTDADVARAIGRRVVAAYLTVPVYAAFHEWLGRGELLAPMLKAWASGDRRGALDVHPRRSGRRPGDPRPAGGLPGAGRRVPRQPAWTPRSSRCCPRPAPSLPSRSAG